METNQPGACKRWAHMSTVADAQGSDQQALWIFGGRAITSLGQALDTWTNALLRMDLSQPFSTGNPPLELVYADRNNSNAPPQVALGQFWSSKDGSSLYQTGGEYSDSPPVEPRANQLWKYDIPGNTWSTVETSGEELLGSAEGATALAPDVGTNGEPVVYQFGGHLDMYTTPNWSGSRVYLSSMTTFDTGNSQLGNLTTFEGMGDSGSRNSTTLTTPPLLRADSTLTYVPNLGTDNKGVLVSIGGGNLDKVLDNSVLDIFDIGAHTFVKQATQGDIMQPRVNHCAVRGSAIVNGIEQHHIFVYGGHAANRTTQIREGQFSDIYILTLPSYTWTYVGADLASQPVPRAGHTCELLGDQMISIGGYISEDIMCEQPGIYLFNTTSLAWATDYVPNQQFTTPTLLRNLTGGQGSSNSTGGSGWQNPKEVYTATVTVGQAEATSTTRQTAELQNGESKSKLGPIIGGVAGGLTLAFLVLFLINFFAKRQRRREHAKWKYQMFPDGGAWNADDDDAASLQAMAYNDVRPVGRVGAVAMAPLDSPVHSRPYSHEHSDSQTSQESWSAARASDEVESATEGMQVSGLTHLAPRETLRVTNPSDRSVRSLSYSATQRSGSSLL